MEVIWRNLKANKALKKYLSETEDIHSCFVVHAPGNSHKSKKLRESSKGKLMGKE